MLEQHAQHAEREGATEFADLFPRIQPTGQGREECKQLFFERLRVA